MYLIAYCIFNYQSHQSRYDQKPSNNLDLSGITFSAKRTFSATILNSSLKVFQGHQGCFFDKMERFEDPTQSNVDLQRPEPSKLNPDAPIFHYSIPFTQSISNTSSPFSIAPSFHPYPYATPDPQIHGEGPFVAALPARDRALVSSQPQLDQRPMWHSDATRVGTSKCLIHRFTFPFGIMTLLYDRGSV